MGTAYYCIYKYMHNFLCYLIWYMYILSYLILLCRVHSHWKPTKHENNIPVTTYGVLFLGNLRTCHGETGHENYSCPLALMSRSHRLASKNSQAVINRQKLTDGSAAIFHLIHLHFKSVIFFFLQIFG